MNNPLLDKSWQTRTGLTCHGQETLKILTQIMLEEFGVRITGNPHKNGNFELWLNTTGPRRPVTAIQDNYRMFMRGCFATLYKIQDITKL